ncbi:MAG: pre-16S rRNA-processing nuclease YqgF [Candidatus Eremiobacteraeota bacterium]|nr:pre-16S rRNA-processing nuclease YqgF [Candidatus Eremiobacteraeota bacterium]MBV8374090.1 pre-16S rRNA-processing nuclease YqgF [Candidatus Eremiobacteraeota bacterium]
MSSLVLGVDPGSSKAGYALVDATGAVIAAGIVPVAELHDVVAGLARERTVAAVAMGRGTRAGPLAAALADVGVPVHLVDEYETSRRARELFFKDHPPRGWRRLVPRGMLFPSRPIDDYAAILIARRFLTRVSRAVPAN